MHAWETIQKSLDFIESNISEDINIEQLAKESALSPFYYQRLFSRLVKFHQEKQLIPRIEGGREGTLRNDFRRVPYSYYPY